MREDKFDIEEELAALKEKDLKFLKNYKK